jgi:CRP/FNR family transcriptional regulator
VTAPEISAELASLGFMSQELLAEEKQFCESVSLVIYEPGDIIYRHGESSDMFFLIRNGLIKLVTSIEHERDRIVRLHKRGSLLGMDGFMDRDHKHTAIAIDEVEAYQIPHFAITGWRDSKSLLYEHFMQKWYEYLEYADIWIADFSTGNIQGRVARLLRFLARFEVETGPQIVELLTTEEMAEILGVTPESVSRAIAEFKRSELLTPIENNAERLFVIDEEKLQAAARQ